MSVGRSSFGLAALGTKIYAVGGSTLVCCSAEVYDPITNAWTPIQSMSTRRHDLGLAVLGTKLYALGGFGGDVVEASVEMYDPNTNTWAIAASMRQGLNSMGAASLVQPIIGERLFIVGGQNYNGDSLASTMVLVDENSISKSASVDAVGSQAWWV